MSHEVNRYQNYFRKILNEEMISGAGGVFGDADSMHVDIATTNTDSYAPDDSRVPKHLGTYSRRGKVKKRKKKA